MLQPEGPVSWKARVGAAVSDVAPSLVIFVIAMLGRFVRPPPIFASLGLTTTLEATQGQILSQSPTDATRFWWHLYGS